MKSRRRFFFVIGALVASPVHAESPDGRLLAEGRRELAAMRSSRYRHRTSVDESSGRFDFDCSGFLDYALARVDPGAYAEIAISKPPGKRPLAQDFFELLQGPSPTAKHWGSVSRAIDLRPGDLIAWRLPAGSHTKDTGHVMIVVGAARTNSAAAHQVLVKVMDSAASGHAEDSRIKHQSGLGTGTIAILNDALDRQAIGFYWRANESKSPHFTRVAFGRLKN